MTLDADTLLALVAISGGVAVVVELVKMGGRLMLPGVEGHPAEALVLRALACALGVAAVVPVWGVSPVEVAVGLLAGAASEVVYRWGLRRVPRLLDRLTGG